MTMRRMAAAVLAVSLGLTGCSGGGDEGADAKSLTLWHYEGPNSAMGQAWTKAIELFKASHPGVEVKFEEKSFEQLQKSAGMILNSDSAPDLMEYNKGNGTAGQLAKQGLLTDISEEVTSRGWDRKLAPNLQVTARYDQDGVMGDGPWYGVPNYGEYVTVYYNRDLFDRYKVKIPTTFDEFTAAMDTFVKNKVTPLSVGGGEYPAQQIFYELALSKADRAWVDSLQMYKGTKVDFHGPQLTYAAQTFSDWVSKGYIAKNAAGIKAEDMGVAWEKGEFPMMISGSWWYGRLIDDIKDKFDWGTFLFPGNTLHPGSSGNIWVVPATSKAKKLAYDFIDITMQPEVQNILGQKGGVPVAADPAAITDPRSKEIIDAFGKISAANGLAYYPDWAAPGYYDVMVGGTQGLINGSKTPQAVLDEIAKPYADNLADLGK
jgi:raffinose/stachyose/melibiose transport system substrate-binding protein